MLNKSRLSLLSRRQTNSILRVSEIAVCRRSRLLSARNPGTRWKLDGSSWMHWRCRLYGGHRLLYLWSCSGRREACNRRSTFAPTTLSPTFEPTLTPTSPQPTETGDTGAPTFPVTDMPSMVPSSSDYWDLPEINYVGDNGNPSGIPLGICEGKCCEMFETTYLSVLF